MVIVVVVIAVIEEAVVVVVKSGVALVTGLVSGVVAVVLDYSSQGEDDTSTHGSSLFYHYHGLVTNKPTTNIIMV